MHPRAMAAASIVVAAAGAAIPWSVAALGGADEPGALPGGEEELPWGDLEEWSAEFGDDEAVPSAHAAWLAALAERRAQLVGGAVGAREPITKREARYTQHSSDVDDALECPGYPWKNESTATGYFREEVGYTCCSSSACGGVYWDGPVRITIGGVIVPGLPLVEAGGAVVARTDFEGRIRDHGALARLQYDPKPVWFEQAGRRLHVRGTYRSNPIDLWPAGREVQGRVVDEFGNAVAGVTVHAQYPGHHAVQTDGQGRFAMSNATPERFELLLSGRDVVEHGSARYVPASEETTQFQLLTVRARRVRLTVVGVEGGPASEVPVYLEHSHPETPHDRCVVEGRTGSEGTLDLLVPPGRNFELTVGAWRSPLRWKGHVRGAVLPAAFEVQLWQAETELPGWLPVAHPAARRNLPTALRVLIWNPATPWIAARSSLIRRARRLSQSPSEGSRYDDFLELPNLSAIPYRIWIWTPGSLPDVLSGVGSWAGVWPPPTVDARRPAGDPVAIHAVSPGGERIGKGSVAVVPESGQGPFLHPGVLDWGASVVEAKRGLHLPPGRYRVSGWTEQRGRATTEDVTFTVPGPTVRLIWLAPKPTVEK